MNVVNSREPGPAEPNTLGPLADVALTVTASFGSATLTIREILALRAESLVTLDRMTREPVDLLANQRLVARGEIVAVGDAFAVRITEVVDPNA